MIEVFQCTTQLSHTFNLSNIWKNARRSTPGSPVEVYGAGKVLFPDMFVTFSPSEAQSETSSDFSSKHFSTVESSESLPLNVTANQSCTVWECVPTNQGTRHRLAMCYTIRLVRLSKFQVLLRSEDAGFSLTICRWIRDIFLAQIANREPRAVSDECFIIQATVL
jgi:hypothetical protein